MTVKTSKGEFMFCALDGNHNLGSDFWEVICETSDITQDQAAQIVDSAEWYFPEQNTVFMNYDMPHNGDYKQDWGVGFVSAVNSLKTLMQRHGLAAPNYAILKKI